MRRVPVLLATVATLAFAPMAVPAPSVAASGEPSATATARCSTGFRGPLRNNFGNLTTKRVSCPKARKIMRQWIKQCAGERDSSCLTSSGFYCRFQETGYEEAVIRCGRRSRKVRFVTLS